MSRWWPTRQKRGEEKGSVIATGANLLVNNVRIHSFEALSRNCFTRKNKEVKRGGVALVAGRGWCNCYWGNTGE